MRRGCDECRDGVLYLSRRPTCLYTLMSPYGHSRAAGLHLSDLGGTRRRTSRVEAPARGPVQHVLPLPARARADAVAGTDAGHAQPGLARAAGLRRSRGLLADVPVI